MACLSSSHPTSYAQFRMLFLRSLPAASPGSLAGQKLAKAATPPVQPPTILLNQLAALSGQRKLTSLVVSCGYRNKSRSSPLAETEGRHAMPQKISPIIFVFGCWSPGFWCCSSWCQSLDPSTFQQHQHLLLLKMLCGKGTAVVPFYWGCHFEI